MADKIKELVKKLGPLRLGALCLCGIFLLFLSSGTGGEPLADMTKKKQNEAETYKEECENQLENILKQIDGVGDAQVMITVLPGENKDYLPAGIVIVCDGGDMPEIKREVTSVVEALFPVESHKIKVMNRRR